MKRRKEHKKVGFFRRLLRWLLFLTTIGTAAQALMHTMRKKHKGRKVMMKTPQGDIYVTMDGHGFGVNTNLTINFPTGEEPEIYVDGELVEQDGVHEQEEEEELAESSLEFQVPITD